MKDENKQKTGRGDDVSHEGFPYGTWRRATIGSVPVVMFRISYVGDLGWEIYADGEHGPLLWETLWEAGRDLGATAVGAGVYGTTGRLEKGYRLMGAELESEYDPVEAGLARPKVKSADFIGKRAYLEAREGGPAAVCCTLVMESHLPVSGSGVPRFPMGGNEPILTLDGERITDGKGRVSRVTSAGAAPSLDSYLLLGYLPVGMAEEGRELRIMYQNELFAVRVARAGSRPLFDPDDRRMKC